MKFSMRVKLVLIVAMLVMMLTGVAWGTTDGVNVNATLDSTGNKLTLEFTFYENGQKINHFAGFDAADMNTMITYQGVRVVIESRQGNGTVYYDGISTSESIYEDRVVAEYTLETASEPGDYLVRYEVWHDDPRDDVSISPEVMENIRAKYPDILVREERYEGNYTNDGQPVSIEKPGSNGAVTISSIQAVPTLDSTGTKLSLEYTFYVDGVKFPHFEEIIGSPELERLKLCNGVRTDIYTVDKTLVRSIISTSEEFYVDRLIAEYTLDTPLESGNYLVRYMVMRNDPNTEVMPDEEMEALQAKYPEVVERDPEGMYANNEQPISIVREGSGNNDDTPPADEAVNTTVTIDLNPDGKIVGISVKTADGSPIPPNVLFKIWLLAQNVQGQSISAKATSDYVGPFVAESGAGGVLNIDVDNLKNPDGSKASITAGSYVVKFTDGEGKYVGTTEAIVLKGTGTTTPPNDNNSGGGCNVGGYGVVALLLAAVGLVTRKSRKA